MDSGPGRLHSALVHVLGLPRDSQRSQIRVPTTRLIQSQEVTVLTRSDARAPRARTYFARTMTQAPAQPYASG